MSQPLQHSMILTRLRWAGRLGFLCTVARKVTGRLQPSVPAE